MDYKELMVESVQYIIEAGGQSSGKLEMVNTPLSKVRAYALTQIPDLDSVIPKFDDNYLLAQKAAKQGKTKRKDMPVITGKDVAGLQLALKSGKIDIRKPIGSNTDIKNPFPEGLKGKEAIDFLNGGLAIYDGETEDDKVQIKSEKVEVGKLLPIQEQIYADKSIKFFTRGSVEDTREFLSNKSFYNHIK